MTDPVSPEAPRRRPSLLVVEDHVDSARLLAVIFRRRGYAVQTAGSVADALRSLRVGDGEHDRGREPGGRPFDVVITDLHLPDGTGADVARAARASGVTGVLALTGDADAAERAADHGFSAFMLKPVRPFDLAAIVRRLAGPPPLPHPITFDPHPANNATAGRPTYAP